MVFILSDVVVEQNLDRLLIETQSLSPRPIARSLILTWPIIFSHFNPTLRKFALHSRHADERPELDLPKAFLRGASLNRECSNESDVIRWPLSE